MAISRCDSIGGPCKITTCNATYVTEGDVIVDVKRNYRDLSSSLNGTVGKALTKNVVEIKFTPVSRVYYVNTLFTKQPVNIGTSIYGCEDCYMKIQGRDGITRRFKAVGIKKPPTVTFSSRKSLFGEVTFGAVVADGEEVGTEGNVTDLLSESFTEVAASSDTSLWIARAALSSWGVDAPFVDMTTDEGVVFSIDYTTKERETDLGGMVDEILTDIKVSAKFTPSNLTQADFATLFPMDGSAAVPGYNEATRAKIFTTTHSPSSNGMQCKLFSAVPEAGAQRWGREVSRYGEITFTALQSVDGSGLANPLYQFSIDD
jgi:hypothetical protein